MRTPPVSVSRRVFLTALAGCAAGRVFAQETSARAIALRVAPDGWGKASPADVESVLRSAAGTLAPFFDGRPIEPVLVVRGREGPIVHYRRNVLKEVVMKLDTQDLYWCQYSYQFAHEFTHVLAGFNAGWNGNKWFEETVCETASLFSLRRMAELWRKDPPNPVWKSYAPRFAEYAGDVIDSRSQVSASRLGDFYRKNAATLRNNPVDRPLNGAIAAVLLPLFESSPEQWRAVSWLNSAPSPEGESFDGYLKKWLRAVPDRHKAFVREIMNLFQVDAGEG